MGREASHYDVTNECQCGRDGDWVSYYRNHWLCLWEVTKEEIVATWPWEDLWKYYDWYEEVVLPAYKAHHEKARIREESSRRLNLLEFREMWPMLDERSSFEELESVDRGVSTWRGLDEPPLPGELGDTDESGSSEEKESWSESDWDSDDDYENVA
ncbi:hypothetical protein N7540_009267 [Penicillium herquei]|nr:hypothetical protein N7540_009267 [Penicillium herquei]